MASRTFLTFLLMLSEAEALVTGGFYADNGVDQTIYYPKISKRERREMQQEILSLLGLNHRPKPHSHETDTSAPRYMLDLYNNLIDRETGEVRTKEKSIANHLGNDDNNLRAMYDADIIMSFVNRGRKKRLKKCRRLHPKRFPKVKLHSSTNWPSCKRRNNTNSTSTADGKIHLRHEKDRRFWFDVSEVPLGEVLMGAELRIYKEAANLNKNTHHGANFSISVYEIVQSSKSKDYETSLVDSTNVTIKHEGWIHLNVSGPISKWLIFPDTNLGLHLRITSDDHEIHPREVRLMGSRARHDQQPFMVAFFKSSQDIHIRQTRAAKQRQRTDVSHNEADLQWKSYETFDMERIQKRSCQKWTLYVSFKELGWQDWIIAPEGYAAFYCAGECSFPLNTHMNATNHAIVQTLVHLMSPYQVPKPCCAPTKLTAISVLYFDDTSNVILKKYRNMVVKSCGCH